MNKSPELSFSDTGKGPVLILIHGFCESKELWKDFQTELSLNNRVICIDIPGFGKSPLNNSEPTLEYYADKIFEVIHHLHLGKVVMAGHSLGGYITLAFAEKYTSFLKGIVLFHSSAYADDDDKRANREKTIDFVKQHGAAAYGPVLIPSLFTTENQIRLKEVIHQLIDVVSETSPEGIIAASRAMKNRKDRINVLKTLDKPVLFFIGKKDKTIPLELSLQQCHLPEKSIACFLSDTAHMGMFESPVITMETLSNFVKQCQKI
jgi:pimeloyl-ACP methyl ester carboxylesterase